MPTMVQIQSEDEFYQNLRRMIKEELLNVIKTLHQTPKEEKLFSRVEVMKLFNISVATLWKRMNDGSIPYFKVGRKVFFKESDIKKVQNELN